MSDSELQGAETPVIEAAQGAETPVIAPKESVTPQVTGTTPVPNAEWQKMQEQMKMMSEQWGTSQLQKFEQENPIVANEKYKEKWDMLLSLKKTPGHKYASLDYEDLLRIMREPVVEAPKPQSQPMIVPSLNPSVSPDLPSEKMSKEVKDYLSLRYTDDQIKLGERAAA